ncbi:MAG: hypothetical protein NXY57DRAFT_967662 [Lentinula lateritia]|nr:MAG: hypothetical protein NXY57DRAFT_967662 [Lentinula lateritia]
MAPTSSQTRAAVSTTLLPSSLAEAQELTAGLKSKSSQPLFFEIASGLDLFCSARMIIQLLHPLIEASDSLDSGEAYNAFEEAAPFLTYVHDFWIGRTNCHLFAEHVLRMADRLFQHLPAFLRDSLEQQWGIPFDHQSSFLGPSDFKQFPVIPISFCLRFREGSAMMRLASPKDLDPFVSLRSSVTETQDSFESSDEKLSVSPPKSNKHKRELVSLMADASTILDRCSNVKSPSKDDCPALPKASSSKKKMEKPVPKPKATARSKTTIKVVEESRVSPESEELATPSYQIKHVRLSPHLCQAAKGKARQMEVLDVEESMTEEEVVPPPSKRLKSSKFAPAPPKASNFRPALLIDEQGRLKLPGDSVEGFTPFKRIEHARNSAPFQRQNPIFDVNPEFLDLGVVLTTQKASFTMQDLLQINSFNSGSSLCFRLVPRRVQSKCFSLAWAQMRVMLLSEPQVYVLAGRGQARQSFLRSFLDLQQAGQDPIVVLEALKAAEPQRKSLSIEDWTLLATLFQWSSPFNLNGLKFDNRTPAEWIDLLRSIHSGASSATVTADGHLVDTSQLPEAAVEVSEALDPQGSPPITVVEKVSGVENLASLSEGSPIQTELDLPQIESLTESTPSPEKGI